MNRRALATVAMLIVAAAALTGCFSPPMEIESDNTAAGRQTVRIGSGGVTAPALSSGCHGGYCRPPEAPSPAPR